MQSMGSLSLSVKELKGRNNLVQSGPRQKHTSQRTASAVVERHLLGVRGHVRGRHIEEKALRTAAGGLGSPKKNPLIEHGRF